uniref:Skp1_POZ domain-containing protein n=1 Tax=Panagrellus redivivus TaxID=6233 RepID=A0A7E4VHQ6_PANRE
MAANNIELPETMKVRTLDDRLMNVPGKLIKESEVLMKAL